MGNNNKTETNAEDKKKQKLFTSQNDNSKEKKLKFLKAGDTSLFWDIFFLCLLIGSIAFFVFLYRKFNKKIEARNSGGLATAEEAVEAYGYTWGRGGYLLGQYIEFDQKTHQDSEKKPLKGNGTDLWLKLEDRFRMTKIQASSGAGKTTQFIVPQLIEDADSGIFNVFCIDRKPPEMAAKVGGVWQSKGHKVINFQPWVPEICWGFEPVFGATSDEIEAMIEILIPISHIEDATWLYRITDRDIVRTVFRCAQIWGKKDRSLATLPGIAKLFKKGVLATREAIESTGNRELIDEIKDVWSYQTGELGKMWRGLAGRFGIFVDDLDVARAFSRSDFTMKDIVIPADQNPENRTILFIGAPMSKGDRSRKIASLMTRLMVIEAFRRGDEMRKLSKTWKDVVPVWQCLDERGTYYIPEDDDSLATLRDLGIAVTIALQSETQLIKWQGRDAAKTNEINFNYYIVLGGCDLEYAKKISEEIGTHWVYTRTESKSKSYESFELGRKKTDGIGYRQVEELVLKPNEIMQLPDDEAIIVGKKSVSTGRKCPPVRVKLYAFYKTEELDKAVSFSQAAFVKQTTQNRRFDEENIPRKTFPLRLSDPILDWNRYLKHN